MRLNDGTFVFSPTDIVNHLQCDHLTQLNRRAAQGELERPAEQRSDVELIATLGNRHEEAYLELLRAEGRSIATIGNPLTDLQRAQRETVEAMAEGAEVIFQATFFDGMWQGHADFLIRTDQRNSDSGLWIYEPYDTKLARKAKVSALVQLADYAHHLESVQGVLPERVHIVLGDNAIQSFPTRSLRGYHRRARQRLTEAVAAEPRTYPEPVDHCKICRWASVCEQQRTEDDHLVYIQGVGRPQIKPLKASGINTATELANSTDDQKPPRMQAHTWHRIRAQAKLQKEATELTSDLLDPADHPLGGFNLLPAPSSGDLFFDIEGDPHRGYESSGLEYLWGVSDADDEFRCWWAHDVHEEQAAFESFVDTAIEALEADPTMHVYHYAAYEETVLKRLASRYSSRVDEVDHLLRNEVLVDLYAVVRHAVRTSGESLSLKKLEPFYMGGRETDVQSGMESVVQYEAWIDGGLHPADRDQTILDDIRGYNRDDCISTRGLRDWLEERRSEAVEKGFTVTRPAARAEERDGRDRSGVVTARQALSNGTDLDPQVAEATRLLGHLLDFHERENKPVWWRHFDQRMKSAPELWEDSEAVAGLVYEGQIGEIKSSFLYRFSFDPQQPHKLKAGKMLDHAPGPKGAHRQVEIHEVDAAEGTLVVKRGKKSADDPFPEHLIATKPVNIDGFEAALADVATAWADDRREHFRPAADLLLRRPPRLSVGIERSVTGESAADAMVRIGSHLDSSCLVVQGPPGTGKTYNGARLISTLVAQGKKVGVVANSHRVIENLLDAVASGDLSLNVLKVGGDQPANTDYEHVSDSAKGEGKFLAGDFDVVGGTAWYFCRSNLRQAFDVLVVDEAGQFSLANTVAASTAAHSLVLLGDPQQLDQPMQGKHPDGVAVSALTHFIGPDASTVPNDLGVFLDDTWRMHEHVCSFVSDTFYDSRLSPAAAMPRRSISRLDPGLYWQPIAHENNRARSEEEASAVADMVARFTAMQVTEDSQTRQLSENDILVITPFNAQLGALRAALNARGFNDVQVGTVDLFQGRQAPVIIYSLAASDGTLAPRGIEFLFSPHRFNVAISRAQVAAVVVGAPALLDTPANRPEQVPMISAFCDYVIGAAALPF